MNQPMATGPATWYIRRGNQVTGPFPHRLLVHYRELGRLKPPDEVSADGVNWFRLDEVPALAIQPIDDSAVAVDAADVEVEGEVDWTRERGRARRRWLEERWIPDRRTGEGGDDAEGQPRGPDRRSDPRARESVHFASDKTESGARNGTLVIAIAVIVGVGLGGFALWRFVPSKTIEVQLLKSAIVDCAAPPAPGVRWTGCDKRNAALAGAELTGAELKNAMLTGADLSRSRLDGANLGNADLRGANLEGASLARADLSGARLDDARWIDGSICEAGSVGHCAGAPR